MILSIYVYSFYIKHCDWCSVNGFQTNELPLKVMLPLAVFLNLNIFEGSIYPNIENFVLNLQHCLSSAEG